MNATNHPRAETAIEEEVWRARDYAEHEGIDRRDYQEGLRRAGVSRGDLVLDLGCGPGGFCGLAADAGAQVIGLDASPAMLEIARERVPEARFDLGDMQHLAYGASTFDIVTAFNSLQFTTKPLAVLAEVRRVAKPGASVFIVVFGREYRIELAAAFRALAPLLPPRPAGSPGPLALSKLGALDDLVRSSGLTVNHADYLDGVFDFPDQPAMLRRLRSGQVAVLAERAAGENVVTEMIIDALSPYRTAAGGYRIEVEWRYISATA